MACEAAKMFVGGIARETTEDELQNYFSKYGNLVECNLKKDPYTGYSRGFAFIAFDDPSAVELVIAEQSHTLGGKTIDPKKMRPKGLVQDCSKIFVGGVDPNLSEAEIRDYFGQFGPIESINLPFDKERNMRKGFCFINFENSEAVDAICTKLKHPLGGREVDVRRATPQEPRNGAQRGGFRPRGGNNWMGGGVRNQYPFQQMGMPYNNFQSYYGQEAQYGGYFPYSDNGMTDCQTGGPRPPMNMNGRSTRGGMNDRYQPY